MTWKEVLQGRWSEALGKVELMGQLIGWESIRRGLRTEDIIRDRWMRDNHAAIYGRESESGSGGSDDVGHLVLGDMTTTYQIQPKKSLLSKALPFVLTAALSIAGVGALAWKLGLLDPAEPPTPSPAEPFKPVQPVEPAKPKEPAEPSDVSTELGVELDRD